MDSKRMPTWFNVVLVVLGTIAAGALLLMYVASRMIAD